MCPLIGILFLTHSSPTNRIDTHGITFKGTLSKKEDEIKEHGFAQKAKHEFSTVKYLHKWDS